MAMNSVTSLSPPPPAQDNYAFAQWIYQAYTILTNTVQLANLTLPVSIANGGSGASTLTAAQTNLGIPSNTTPLAVTVGGTNTTSFTSYTPVCGGTTTTGTLQSVASLGSSGQVLTSNGAGALPSFQFSKVIQQVNSEVGTLSTGTTTIPLDNTIPQNTEGDQYLSLSITPKSASNILVISVNLQASSSVVANVIAALFQDTTANALASMIEMQDNINGSVNIAFKHIMIAGTTSSTTFKVRVGADRANTLTFNGSAGAGLFGGTMASSIMIEEYAP